MHFYGYLNRDIVKFYNCLFMLIENVIIESHFFYSVLGSTLYKLKSLAAPAQYVLELETKH